MLLTASEFWFAILCTGLKFRVLGLEHKVTGFSEGPGPCLAFRARGLGLGVENLGRSRILRGIYSQWFRF